MRKIINLNESWAFQKTDSVPTAYPLDWETVSLPHTWNAKDGQDGGNDYYRGKGVYAKVLKKSELPKAEVYFLELCGVNSIGEVYLDGKKLCTHEGGYSRFRVELPLQEESLLVVTADNSENDRVYPQMADFTFYGGVYRDVNLICADHSRFALNYYGGEGIKITPRVQGEKATVECEAFLENAPKEAAVRFCLIDGAGRQIQCVNAYLPALKAQITIENPRLWQGKKDPYLYTVKATLLCGETIADEVCVRVGIRSFFVDPEKGFFLNGEAYPLRGVSRHQDWLGIGNALKREHHEKDIELIKELGATTVRLAHYQHDEVFYRLCDETGLVVWAEIPYISKHLKAGDENTLSQMRELIVQNYHHPSIVCWGLSNEITMGGEEDERLIENHRRLNALCKELDDTRLTTVAAVSMCSTDAAYLKIPDLISYNHYFGWYGGDTSMNGPWLDEFHQKYPKTPIGLSEYGCEALNWHTSNPMQGDYTEEYQAYYHEELIKQLFSREYLWATHVWNMFDFGADAREEGGENGQNHKGLVTFDRKYKKDSFYAYKAWLSDEPFVHLCGKRYINRVEDLTKITVYSNLPSVELFVNGKSVGKQTSANHFFYFEVENQGESALKAVAGECVDESRIRKVEKFDESYLLKEKNAVLNWFDVASPKGKLSLLDKVQDILKTNEGAAIMQEVFGKLQQGGTKVAGFEMSPKMMEMMGGFTFLRLSGMMGMMGVSFTKEELLKINAKLNKIDKA
ncbi:MAG: glycoside hydrolase family 2 protein [Clostridia bacterium]|nr:glycoside hydrolase family 2 protein [Clostridia bacterium]